MSIEQLAGLTTLAASLAFLMVRFFTNRKPRQKKNNIIQDAPIRLSTHQIQGNKPPQQDALFRVLLTKAQGDHGKANRLIEFERRKQPAASKFELTKAAIERLERDTGR